MSAHHPTVEIRKLIRVSKEKVFEAWANPGLMARWMAPGNAAVLKCEVDFKVGGKYRLHLKGEMLGHNYDVVIGGVYRDIVPNKRLSFTWVYEGNEHREAVGNSIVTVALTSVKDGTELTLVHEKIATKERREGHLWGWNNCLEKLDAVVSGSI